MVGLWKTVGAQSIHSTGEKVVTVAQPETRKKLTFAALGVFGVAAAVGAGVAALGAKLARSSVEVDRGGERPIRVLSVLRGAQAESGDYEAGSTSVWMTGLGADAPGAHSLLFESAPHDAVQSGAGAAGTTERCGSAPLPVGELGHAQLGPVVGRRDGAVLRRVVSVTRGDLSAGSVGRMVGWWYSAPEDLGLRVERITYPTELGDMEAWIVRPRWPRKRRWAVHVHGRGADAAEALRGVIPAAAAGITSMVIRYRNDAGQPAGERERYAMGLAEAHDVDAAVGEALSRGAERVTLFGWSMGGTACLVAARDGRHRGAIDGMVLDSPATDWPGLLRAQTRSRRLPGWIADLGMAYLSGDAVKGGVPGGLNLEELTPEAFAPGLAVPTLILASEADQLVPWQGSLRLAELRPDMVQLEKFYDAGHVRLWNANPERWEARVLMFLRALPKPAWRGE